MAIKCGLKLNVPDEVHLVLKAVAEAEEILEAVFFGEVDGFKLIRSLKIKDQDLVELIEETIKNSTNRRKEAEVDRPTEAVVKEIELVSEECLEPSAAYEELVDQPNEETGADSVVGDVTIEHLPVEGRIEVNVTSHSDVAEGSEMVYPAVEDAQRDEDHSFDHSIGADIGLTKAAGNEFSEDLVLTRRNSVASCSRKLLVWRA